VEIELIFGGFEDGKWQLMERGFLGIKILVGEWPESGQKTPKRGFVVAAMEVERKREKGEL